MPQSKKEDFEDKVDEQEASVERLQKEDSDLQAKKKEIMAGEEAAMAAVKNRCWPIMDRTLPSGKVRVRGHRKRMATTMKEALASTVIDSLGCIGA